MLWNVGEFVPFATREGSVVCEVDSCLSLGTILWARWFRGDERNGYFFTIVAVYKVMFNSQVATGGGGEEGGGREDEKKGRVAK